MHKIERFRAILLSAATLMFVIPGVAQQQPIHPLTNSEIVKMVRAGIPEGVIERCIQVSGTDFAATPEALIHLKNQQVPDGVLATIVDGQAAQSATLDQAGGVYGVPGHSPRHPLPNVDATVRLDSRTVGKVQVRKNEIKVEKAGVPLVSVKWKAND